MRGTVRKSRTGSPRDGGVSGVGRGQADTCVWPETRVMPRGSAWKQVREEPGWEEPEFCGQGELAVRVRPSSGDMSEGPFWAWRQAQRSSEMAGGSVTQEPSDDSGQRVRGDACGHCVVGGGEAGWSRIEREGQVRMCGQ